MDNEKVKKLSWTSSREFLDSISTQESRERGGLHSAHVVHGWHKDKINPRCDLCRAELKGQAPEEKQ
jgi:hypothetical protein